MSPEGLTGFSRGLFSNWLWHRPLHLLVDAGEGLQLALGCSVFAPRILALTHGHSDHVLGLPGFVGARRFGKGATDKPLTILHPSGSRGVQAVRDLLAAAYPGVGFPVTWVGLDPGGRHPLGPSRVLEAFTVRHTPGEPALGYRIVETRRRLKAAFAGLPRPEIEARARRGERDAMMEDVRHILFAHSGDAMPVDPDEVRGADLLVHDATFLHEPDRRAPIHATTQEALDVARAAGVRQVVLHHLSVRYPRPQALTTLRQQVTASGFEGRAWLLDDDAFVALR
jgi:ribonuclease Z